LVFHTLGSGSFPTVNALFRACYKSRRRSASGAASGLRTLVQVQTVSIGRRFGALVIDWAVAVLSASVLANTTVPPEGLRESFLVSGAFIVEVGLLTGLLGFSIGKRLLGLKVEGPDGRPIGVPRALLRTFLLALVIPALVMNDERRGIHDVATRSRVIRLQD
jgi:uncharacterized RDD family membrane protein YckC